jgi:hypothetical protein
MQYGGREQRKFVFEKVAAMSTWRGRRREELPLATQASRTEQAALVVALEASKRVNWQELGIGYSQLRKMDRMVGCTETSAW